MKRRHVGEFLVVLVKRRNGSVSIATAYVMCMTVYHQLFSIFFQSEARTAGEASKVFYEFLRWLRWKERYCLKDILIVRKKRQATGQNAHHRGMCVPLPCCSCMQSKGWAFVKRRHSDWSIIWMICGSFACAFFSLSVQSCNKDGGADSNIWLVSASFNY